MPDININTSVLSRQNSGLSCCCVAEGEYETLSHEDAEEWSQFFSSRGPCCHPLTPVLNVGALGGSGCTWGQVGACRAELLLGEPAGTVP